MVKEAYSVELKRVITAELAHKKSLYGELQNKRAFKCSDKRCNVPLTCTKWNLKDHKRIYFSLSSKATPHIAGCNISGEKEEKQRSNIERNGVKSTVKKNGLVVLKKILEQKNIQKRSRNDIAVNNPLGGKVGVHKANQPNMKTSSERSYLTSILTCIELFKDTTFDCKRKFLQIDSKVTISLEEFFFKISDTTSLPEDKIRIFFGEVKVESYKRTGLKISFCDSKSTPPIFTNKKKMFEKYYGKHAKTHIDTNQTLYVFFRGYIKENKWESYNNHFNNDLYFSKESL